MSDDDMCPNCLTPWKCNGPHLGNDGLADDERAEYLRRFNEGVGSRSLPDGVVWSDVEEEVKIQAATQYVKDRGWHLPPEERAKRFRNMYARDEDQA